MDIDDFNELISSDNDDPENPSLQQEENVDESQSLEESLEEESSEDSEEGEEDSDEVTEESMDEQFDVEEILLEMSSRLENLEKKICATPDPDVTFFQTNVSDLNAAEGILFLILLCILYFLIKDLIGGVLRACIRR